LETDLKTTQASQAKVQHLLDSLTNVGTESDKSRSEERRKLERQVQDLQQEACAGFRCVLGYPANSSNDLRQQLTAAKEATLAAEVCHTLPSIKPFD